MGGAKQNSMSSSLRFETRAIRAGQPPCPATGAIVPPIYAATNYQFESLDREGGGYEYSRVQNPTRKAAEECLASLEGANHAFLFASGMAAESAVFGLLSSGDHVVCIRDVYGGTISLLKMLQKHHGIETTYVDCAQISEVEAAFRPNTRLLWLESPTNPLTYVIDLRSLCALGKRHGAWVAVDNTFATPFLQNPLSWGADFVVHSATKYLGGHSDLTAGAVALNDAVLADAIWDQQAIAGGILSPFEAWLTLRGMKTLAIRMRAHQENAMAVARFLSEHPKIERVLYPGLPDHPQHTLANEQMRGFGGMVCAFVKGGREETKRFCEGTRLFLLASSLGGVESLIGYPLIMSHSGLTEEERRLRAIADNMVRLSVGIEHGDDLIEDLDQALKGS